MRVLPPHYLCGQQAGPARDGGGEKERPLGGPKGTHVLLCALVKRIERDIKTRALA